MNLQLHVLHSVFLVPYDSSFVDSDIEAVVAVLIVLVVAVFIFVAVVFVFVVFVVIVAVILVIVVVVVISFLLRFFHLELVLIYENQDGPNAERSE